MIDRVSTCAFCNLASCLSTGVKVHMLSVLADTATEAFRLWLNHPLPNEVEWQVCWGGYVRMCEGVGMWGCVRVKVCVRCVRVWECEDVWGWRYVCDGEGDHHVICVKVLILNLAIKIWWVCLRSAVAYVYITTFELWPCTVHCLQSQSQTTSSVAHLQRMLTYSRCVRMHTPSSFL